jgi:hypothetical protein
MIMINRSLTYQCQTHILNQKDDLMRLGGIEEEKIDFQLEYKITNAVIDELLSEIQGLQNKQVA